MRARRIKTRSGCRPRGTFPSAKLGKQVHFESVLEKNACLLLEYSSGVRSYQEQPLVRLPTGECRYPDFEVIDHDGQITYVEVKSCQQLARPDVAERLRNLAEYLDEQGLGYQILTDAEINRQPRLDNLRLLFAYRSPTLIAMEPSVEALIPEAPLPYRDVASHIGCATKALSLLADQRLVFDLNIPFSLDVLVSRPTGARHESFLF